jgi:hypothetical protein
LDKEAPDPVLVGVDQVKVYGEVPPAPDAATTPLQTLKQSSEVVMIEATNGCAG